MATAVTVISSVLAGAVFWTFCEYAAHRFAMHDNRSPRAVASTHLAHHVDPAATVLIRRMLSYVSIALVAVPIWWASTRLAGLTAGTIFAVTWWIAYGWYEQVHWRFHHRPPRRATAAGLRRRHFAHHFGSPASNFGVTTSLWDRVFGTHAVVDQVQVPRRLAMSWVVDESGDIRPDHADSYRLAPRRSSAGVPR